MWVNAAITKVASLLQCRSPGTNLSSLIPTKNISTAAKIPQVHTNNNTTPQGILLLSPNTAKCFEQKAQPAGPHALHTESRLALPHKWCNDTWAINLSPLCLSRFITEHALGEWMTGKLQLKNKSTVAITCISFAQGRDPPLLLPCRRSTSVSYTAHISSYQK